MGLRRACRSNASLGKRFLFLLDNMALVLGSFEGVVVALPNLSHTCREVCVISLAIFTIPVCRWIASEDNPTDEPSRSKRHRPDMQHDVDQRGTCALETTADSELFTSFFFSEAARVASEGTIARTRCSKPKSEEEWERTRVRFRKKKRRIPPTRALLLD